MSPTLLHEAHPKARKVHACNCCGGDIPAGISYCRDTLVYDGRVYDWKTCADCEPLTNVVWQWSTAFADEGIGRDEYIEWASEHQTDPQHGPAARALLLRAGCIVEEVPQ